MFLNVVFFFSGEWKTYALNVDVKATDTVRFLGVRKDYKEGAIPQTVKLGRILVTTPYCNLPSKRPL